MSGTLIICEKPSQARALKAALGEARGKILPARGHILTLEEPEDVRPEWKKWSADLLWPGKFYGKKPVKDTLDYLDRIRAAARGAREIIIATDCDREGQVIGDEIVDFIGFKGPVRRAIFNAEDATSLQQAFAKVEDNSTYLGRYMAGQAREQADQISNLSMTRAATVTLKAPGTTGAIGVGRVKTPVLAIVCKRELEIENFKPEDMFEIDAETKVAAGSITLTCSRAPASLIRAEAQQDDEEDEGLEDDMDALKASETVKGRITNSQLKDAARVASALKEAVKGYQGKLRSKSERKKQAPPKLFDLTSLQATCSSRFSWSGGKTLNVAQSLYSTHTLITYPRGEAKHLPENNIGDIPKLVPALLRLGRFSKHAPLLKNPQPRKGKSGHFSDAALKGLSHYAIIPNVNTADSFSRVVPQLNEDEAKLFDLVTRQYLAALAPDHEYRQTTVDMTFPLKRHDWGFRASGRVPLVPGWKEILGGASASDPDAQPDMCPVENGETGLVTAAAIRTVTTRPPARYSEGALIKVMQEAWRLVDDPAMRARLKEAKGIGTPATRDTVIKGLIDQRQLVRNGKTLVPSPGGMDLYKLFAEVCPNIVDPARTAQWETIFDMVEAGKMDAVDAVKRIISEVKRDISRITENSTRTIAVGAKQKPTPAMANAAKNIAEAKGMKLPAGCLTDSSICRKFLDEHAQKRPVGEDGKPLPSTPSEKQLALAERLAKEAGAAVPDSAKASAREMSLWIDAQMKKAPPRPPSEKQLALANKLASEHSIDLPADVESSMKACSDFIDKMMGGGSGKKKAGGGKSGGRSTGGRPGPGASYTRGPRKN